MRRRRQQLSEAESIHILEKATPVAHWLFWEMAAIPTPFPSVLSMPRESCISTVPCGHKVDALRACDKASFCVIEQDCVQPKEYTTYFRSVIPFGRAHIIEDESEKLENVTLIIEPVIKSNNIIIIFFFIFNHYLDYTQIYF